MNGLRKLLIKLIPMRWRVQRTMFSNVDNFPKITIYQIELFLPSTTNQVQCTCSCSCCRCCCCCCLSGNMVLSHKDFNIILSQTIPTSLIENTLSQLVLESSHYIEIYIYLYIYSYNTNTEIYFQSGKLLRTLFENDDIE